jgi:DNA uptake protein ComE-like DNA-binding protein
MWWRSAMAQRHWLDPLARQVLRAAGQIPAPSRQPRQPAQPACSDAPSGTSHGEQVERDLLALKLQQDPNLRLADAAAVARAAALGWRLDVNRATAADWLRLPGLEPAQVDLLLRLQAGGVQLSGSDDLQRVLELPEAVVQAWLPLLEFRWYGEPAMAAGPPSRIDLNRASARELEPLGLGQDRLNRLLRERGRGPFQDLADLQQRLQLPAAVVESWIGRVQFRPGPAGPVLPPGTRGR